MQTVRPPANLIAACAPPTALTDDKMGTMAAGLLDNTAALLDCARKHKLLVEWVTHK